MRYSAHIVQDVIDVTCSQAFLFANQSLAGCLILNRQGDREIDFELAALEEQE